MANKRKRNAPKPTDPTSEVGSDTDPNNMSDMWREFFVQQNNNLLNIIKSMQAPINSEVRKVCLPKFDPCVAESDAASWCSTADVIMNDNPLHSSALIMALSAALKGEASHWLTQVCFPEITWNEFRELFMQRYGNKDTAAGEVMKLLNARPTPGECLSAFGNRLVTTLEAKWKNKTVQEIAVSVVLASLTQIDGRLKRLAYTTDIKSRSELQHELMAYSFNNKISVTTDEFQAKKFKPAALIKCHYCGNMGHKLVDCQARKEQERIKPSRQSITPSRKIVCYTCGVEGHISSKCTRKNNTTPAEKRVNLCQVVAPKGVLQNNGESFQFFFDSGADCSLMRESVAEKFSGKRQHNIISLKGIGNTTTCSTLQILSMVKIGDVYLEILFHVISNDVINYDVMVGREILTMGFDVLCSMREFKIVRIPSISMVTTNTTKLNLSHVNTDLIDSEKHKLLTILEKYSESFISGVPKKRVTTGQLEIRLIDKNKTVQRKPYRLSPTEREIVRNKINELIKAEIVRPSCSPFASPILLVKKKNNTDRLCVDYRELNCNTVSDKYPLPLISDQIARLKGAKYFTCLDMASGFHQIPIHPDSIERTAFVTPDGQFEYLTMPFGLKNAPSVFQRAIVKALGELAYSFVVVYMDDVMVFASTKQEAYERLQKVLEILTVAGFSLNVEKCSFMKTCVEYLGFVVKEGELNPNPRKITALTKLPPPQTVTQLRQFIGLASYFRIFVNNFSVKMKPLYALTSAKTLEWKPIHENIRLEIIQVLTSQPVLTIFDPQYPTELHTDASSEGYGAILLQKINGKLHPVEYFSKTTSASESKYHSYDLETLAVVKAVKHFRHYLHGLHFTVYTDCNSLKSSRTKKELTPRAHRWWAYLQSFDFDVVYREGKRMSHVDFLSRNPVLPQISRDSQIEQKIINLAEITDDWLLAEQKKDPEICSIVDKLTSGDMAAGLANTFEIRKGILYRKIEKNSRTKVLAMVPRALRWAIINHVHEAVMHLGWLKTRDKMYEHYWFEKMSKYVRKFVENCITCKLSKSASGKVQSELHPIPKIEIPWHTVHVDLTGKLSGKSDVKEYIIVQICAFTKFVFLHHTLNINAESCIKSFKSSISLFGIPNRIIADQGRCFASKDFRDFCSTQNIALHLIATGASRANGQVERVMSTLKSLLTAVETSNRSWQDAIGEIQLAINSTTSKTTHCSPLEMLIGKQARPFNLLIPNESEHCVDKFALRRVASKHMKESAVYEKQRFDRNKAKIIKFNKGDFVLIKSEERHQTKLDPKFKGPFQIIDVLDNDRYMLKSLKDKRVYKYAHEFLRKMPDCSPDNVLETENYEKIGNSIRNVGDSHYVNHVADDNEVNVIEEGHSNDSTDP